MIINIEALNKQYKIFVEISKILDILMQETVAMDNTNYDKINNLLIDYKNKLSQIKEYIQFVMQFENKIAKNEIFEAASKVELIKERTKQFNKKRDIA